MRISADSKSADWHPVANFVKVFLDGVGQTHCIIADEERGQIIRFARDDAGKILVSRQTGDAMTVCEHGIVRIDILAEHQHLMVEFPFGPMEALGAPIDAT